MANKTSQNLANELKKELDSNAILSAKSIALMQDNSFVSQIVDELEKQNLQVLIAEKLLFPPANSQLVLGYTVLASSAKELLALNESEIAKGEFTQESTISSIKIVNTPRRILVALSAKPDQFKKRAVYDSLPLSTAIFLIYAIATVGFIGVLATSFLASPTSKKQKQLISTTRDLLVRDIENSVLPALLIIDVDNFSQINEFYSHKVGDFFLDEFYKILGFYLPKNGKLYKLGGDEFAILLNDSSRNEAESLAKELVGSIPKEAVFYEEFEIGCEIFVGVAFSSTNLLEKADIALKAIKKQQLKKSLMFTRELDPKERHKETLSWAKKIHQAISKEQVVSHFQPIIDAKTSEIISYEALVRIIDDTGKEILPFKFLKSAKLSKQYTKLSRALLKRTIADFSLRKDNLSVNITIDDIKDADTINFTSELIRRYNLEGRIIFEIALSQDPSETELIAGFIKQFRELGCEFAIDNFGASFVNLKNILALKPNYIKLDATIIENIDNDLEAFALAKAIVVFATALGIKTVAKFVSTESLKEKALELGVDYLQGFGIAKPASKI